jgi:predicted nuclease of predicted toxin-antitoxin system
MFLLDQNLSRKLKEPLSPHFPLIDHIVYCGLDDASDMDIWKYAKQNNMTVITKDADFMEICQQFGFPPKIIWVRMLNASNKDYQLLLINNKELIFNFLQDSEWGVLALHH